MYVLSIDLGTTGCKTAIFDLNNIDLVKEIYNEYPLIVLSSKEIEQDANLLWDIIKSSIKGLVNEIDIKPKDIKAISISSQGISFVPVDKNLNPIYNTISWLDTRAEEETKLIKNKFTVEYLFKKTGKRISPAYTLPKLIWFKNNRPDLFKRTYKFLMLMDFIISKLTGSIVTDHTMASGTFLYDLSNQEWSKEILESFYIPLEKLPEIRWGGEIVGYIKKDVAEELNLEKSTLVVLGGQDQKCGVFGCSIIDKDLPICISFGTAIAISKVTNFYVLDHLMRIPCFSFLRPSLYDLEGVVSTGGSSLNWLKDILRSNSFDDMMKEGEKSKDNLSKPFFLPHLTGASSPYWKEDLTGILYGLSLSTSRGDIVCSVIEGLAFQVKENIEIIENLTDKTEKIVMFGGGVRGSLIREIFVNVLERELYIFHYPDMPLIGASILSGIALGIFRSPKDVESLMIEKAYSIYPEIEKAKRYKELYLEYLNIQDKFLK